MAFDASRNIALRAAFSGLPSSSSVSWMSSCAFLSRRRREWISNFRTMKLVGWAPRQRLARVSPVPPARSTARQAGSERRTRLDQGASPEVAPTKAKLAGMTVVRVTLPREVSEQRLELFCLLQQLETWFRELVYVETKSHYATGWWQACELALKQSRRAGIPPARSMRADQRHPHMATPENDPLWFLSFDSLLRILFDKRLWRLFAPYLTTKQLVRSKLDEIMPVRHRIAHARAINAEDLPRVQAVIRDLDQGFWRFCTSYNDDRGFIAGEQQDPVYRHFLKRIHVRWVETQPNTWAEVGSRAGAHLDIIMRYGLRPSARPRPRKGTIQTRGVFYDVTFSAAHTREYLHQTDILRSTRRFHDRVIHIFLDADEQRMRVTVPSILGTDAVVETLEAFDAACRMYLRPGPAVFPRVVAKRKRKGKGLFTNIDVVQRTRAIASEWPHYVVPSDNPLSFLGPDMPARFFS
jgi:hypothetical protein